MGLFLFVDFLFVVVFLVDVGAPEVDFLVVSDFFALVRLVVFVFLVRALEVPFVVVFVSFVSFSESSFSVSGREDLDRKRRENLLSHFFATLPSRL